MHGRTFCGLLQGRTAGPSALLLGEGGGGRSQKYSVGQLPDSLGMLSGSFFSEHAIRDSMGASALVYLYATEPTGQ